jgi:uncharacterized protein with HEPN domain
MPRDRATVLDIVLACRRIQRFTSGLGRDEFLGDEKTQSAVLHQLLVIGEAAKRVSGSFRDAHVQVPWRDMAGMRDRLVHQYDAVDLDEVWKTIETEISRVLTLLEPTVGDEPATELGR